MDIQQRFESLVGEATLSVSESTEKQYKRIVKNYLKSEYSSPSEYLRNISPRSFYRARAAICWWLLGFSLKHMNSENQKMLSKVKNTLDLVEEIKMVSAPPFACTKSGKGSRKRIPKYSNGDWRLKMILASPTRFKPIISLLYLTGCRPSEIEKGVQVIRTKDLNILVVIGGAKVTDSNGQEKRAFLFEKESKNQAVKIINNLLNANDQHPVVVNMKTDAIRKNIKSLRNKVNFTGKKAPSPYSFRHQFCSDLKKMKYSRESIAMMMGHRSTRTQSAYGSYVQGKNGGSSVANEIVDYDATNKVRVYEVTLPKNTHRSSLEL